MTSHSRPARFATVTLVFTFVVSACSAAASPATSSTVEVPPRPADQNPPGRIPVSPTPVPVTGEVPQPIIDAALALLANKVGSAAETATLVVAEAVTWPDGSMGCPEPGVYYTQEPVAGYRLVFQLNGTRYDFRAAESGNLRACEPRGPRAS